MSKLTLAEGQKLLRANALEAEVQSAVTDYLAAKRIPYTITEAKRSYNERGQQVRRINPGWPDITGCHPTTGQLLGIECKRTVGGVLSYDQAFTLSALFRAGALVVIARSVDDVLSLLETRRVSDATKREIADALAKGQTVKTKRKRNRLS